MADVLHPLVVLPGIQRDGTDFAKNTWIDGQWVRFQRGLPRKIGGYRQIVGYTNSFISNVPRGIFIVANGDNFNVYVGTYSSIGVYTIDSMGNFLSFQDLTPLVQATNNPFDATNVNNLWTFDIIVDRNGTPEPVVIMSVAPNITV